MKNKTLFRIWPGLYLACVGLSFVPNPQGLVKAVSVLLSVGFFVPAVLLLYRGFREKDPLLIGKIRLISALSLGLTLLLLVANFLCIHAPEAVGNALYGLLILVSCPMVSLGYWFVSLFIWACLWIASLKKPAK